MFFILSKTVAALLHPLNVILFAGALGVALMATRWRRAGIRVAAASLGLLLVLGLLPVGYDLSHMLERQFPRWDASRGAPDGIVVLGGAISTDLSRAHGEPILNADAGRVVAIARLAREFPNARIVYSGGDASLSGTGAAEARYLPALLDQFGVARERVALESAARNTAENATFSRQLAQPKAGERWLLVTSAQHMPRAVGCFRQAGFAVEAYPVAWRTGRRYAFWPNLDVIANLMRFESAAREWIGLTAYWLTGRTSEWLPAAS